MAALAETLIIPSQLPTGAPLTSITENGQWFLPGLADEIIAWRPSGNPIWHIGGGCDTKQVPDQVIREPIYDKDGILLRWEVHTQSWRTVVIKRCKDPHCSYRQLPLEPEE